MFSRTSGGFAPLLLSAALAVACGDDSSPATDGASDKVDAGGIDLEVDIGFDDIGVDASTEDQGPPAETNIGEGCQRNADCKAGSPLCLIIDSEQGIGVCSKECTPDDPNTPAAQRGQLRQRLHLRPVPLHQRHL